ncbi:MAG: hypothetical protein ACJAZV_002389, partial [Roseivirga sp.]
MQWILILRSNIEHRKALISSWGIVGKFDSK